MDGIISILTYTDFENRVRPARMSYALALAQIDDYRLQKAKEPFERAWPSQDKG